MSKHIAGRLESWRLHTIRDINEKIDLPDGNWQGSLGDETVSITERRERGMPVERRLFLFRKIRGCVVTSEVVIAPGEFDNSTPAVRAVHYTGPDAIGADSPVCYDSVNRDRNVYLFGLPDGIAQAVSTARRVQELHEILTADQVHANG